MISYRPELTVKKMVFRVEGVELGNLQLAPLKGCFSPETAVVSLLQLLDGRTLTHCQTETPRLGSRGVYWSSWWGESGWVVQAAASNSLSISAAA